MRTGAPPPRPRRAPPPRPGLLPCTDPGHLTRSPPSSSQASSAGTLFEDIFEPEAAGLAAQLSNRSQQLAWQAVHGREGPPVALLVNDARAVCYELSVVCWVYQGIP